MIGWHNERTMRDDATTSWRDKTTRGGHDETTRQREGGTTRTTRQKKGGISRGNTTTSRRDKRTRGWRNKRTRRVDATASWRYERTLNEHVLLDVYKWCPSEEFFPTINQYGEAPFWVIMSQVCCSKKAFVVMWGHTSTMG